MKIQTIGTGAILSPDVSAATLIDNKVLIDCGPGVLKKLLALQTDISNLDAVLITHLHADHFFDLPFLFLALNILAPENNIEVFLPKGGKKIVEQITSYMIAPEKDAQTWIAKAGVRLVEYGAGENVSVGKVEAEPMLVDHGDMKPAYGFVLKIGEKKIGVSGDSKYCEGVRRIVEDSQLCVLDASFDKASASHMGIEDVVSFCKEYPKKKFIATHMSTEARCHADDIKLRNLIIPVDGQIVLL